MTFPGDIVLALGYWRGTIFSDPPGRAEASGPGTSRQGNLPAGFLVGLLARRGRPFTNPPGLPW